MSRSCGARYGSPMAANTSASLPASMLGLLSRSSPDAESRSAAQRPLSERVHPQRSTKARMERLKWSEPVKYSSAKGRYSRGYVCSRQARR